MVKAMFNHSLSKAFVAGAVCMASAIFSPYYQLKAQTNSAKKTTPATVDQVQTYTGISTAIFCRARQLEVDYQKSLALAISVQGEVIFVKHGGVVPGSSKPLEQKQFLNSAPIMVMAQALRVCPKMIPAEEKKKIEADIKKIQSAQKRN